MSAKVKNEKKAQAPVKGRKGRKKRNSAKTGSTLNTLEIALVGTEGTVMIVRKAQPEDG